MERWYCPDCESRVPINREQCNCGYIRTEYDLAGAAEDTGAYLINRLSMPELEKIGVKLPLLKIITSIIVGVGIGSVVIIFLKHLLFK